MDKRSRLSAEQIEEGIGRLDGWTLEEGKRIARKRMFPSFAEAIRYVNRVAEWAEANDHHPFIAIDYRRVTLTLTTWHAGGLTALDLEAAAAFDRMATASEGDRI